MITETEKEELKEILGRNYTRKVLSLLNKNSESSTEGKKYSIQYVRQVFNGLHDNLDVEIAIYDLRNEIISKQKELKEKKSFSPPENDQPNN
jgi:hypothetical protein